MSLILKENNKIGSKYTGKIKFYKNSTKLIKRKGALVLEIGFDQADKVKEILRENGFYINKVLKDYSKNDRCIISTKI